MTNIRRIERSATLEERIRDEIYALIKQGHYGPGQPLPSETALANDFGVSRATIRAALSFMASQGIVVRKHGSGTFVNHPNLRLRLQVSEQWEFQDMIRSSGYEPGIEFIDSSTCMPDVEAVTALQINPNETVLKIRKIFTADNIPAIYSINILSLQLAVPPHNLEQIKGPIFPYLQEIYGEIPSYSITELSPVVATEELAGLLKVDLLSPLLLFKDIFFNAEHQPILYGHNHFTNILHFKAIRQPNANWV